MDGKTTNTAPTITIDTIQEEQGGEYIVMGRVTPMSSPYTVLYYWAANPADHATSFTGSGIPFPNPEVAFDNTPNRGHVQSPDGYFRIRIRYPNAFYTSLGTNYVDPTLYVQIGNSSRTETAPFLFAVNLANGIPFRMHNYPVERTGPHFYDRRGLPAGRTQEQILRDRGYPRVNNKAGNPWFAEGEREFHTHVSN